MSCLSTGLPSLNALSLFYTSESVSRGGGVLHYGKQNRALRLHSFIQYLEESHYAHRFVGLHKPDESLKQHIILKQSSIS